MPIQRKDYMLAGASGVITGAKHGFITTKAPQAVANEQHDQIIQQNHQTNALLAAGLCAAGHVSSQVGVLNQSAQQQLGRLVEMGQGIGHLDHGMNRMGDQMYEVNQGVQTLNQNVSEVAGGIQTLNQNMSEVAGGLSSVAGEVHGLRQDVQVNTEVTAQGFNHMGQRIQHVGHHIVGAISDVSDEVQGLRHTTRDGFDRTIDKLQAVTHGVHKVASTLGRIPAHLDRGFTGVGTAIREQAAQNRALQTHLARWTDQRMGERFDVVCDHISLIDETLVKGFGSMTQQVQRSTDNILNKLAYEHALDRATLMNVGQQLASTIQQEGYLTRDAIYRIGASIIESQQQEGHLTRSTMQQDGRLTRSTIDAVGQRITASLTALAKQLERDHARPQELKARELTRPALNFMKENLFEDARSTLDAAIGKHPGYFSALFLRGTVAISLEESLDDIARHFRRALAQAGAIDPQDRNQETFIAHLMLGRTHTMRGVWEEAIHHFQESLKLSPQHLVATIELAFAILHDPRMGTTRAARAKRLMGINGVLDGLPPNIRPLGWYGLALLLADCEPNEALEVLLRGLQHNRESGHVHRDGDPLALFEALNSLYPALVPFLYAAMMSAGKRT